MKFWLRTFGILGVICIIVIAVIGCDDELSDFDKRIHFDDDRFRFEEEKFMTSWDAWNNLDIKDYSFKLKIGSDDSYRSFASSRSTGIPHNLGGYEYNIIVKDGKMDSFEYIPPLNWKDDSLSSPYFTSISDMYQKIYDEAQARKGFSGDGRAESMGFSIEYDSDLFFISFFTIYAIWKDGFSAQPPAPYFVADFKILE